MVTHVDDDGKKSSDVRCRQNSGAIDRGHDHVGGLPDKQVQAADSTSQSRADTTDDGRQVFLCRVLRVGIDCIVVSEPIKTRERVRYSRNWLARGVTVSLRPFRTTATDCGAWRSTTGLANTAAAAVKRTEAVAKKRIVVRRARQL